MQTKPRWKQMYRDLRLSVEDIPPEHLAGHLLALKEERNHPYRTENLQTLRTRINAIESRLKEEV